MFEMVCLNLATSPNHQVTTSPKLCVCTYGEDIFLSTEEDYCLYPDCTDEKEFDGAQFCSEDHLDQASDEGRFSSLHFQEMAVIEKTCPK